MQIRLLSHHLVLAESVAAALREHGHAVEVRPDTVFECELRYGPETPLAQVTGVVEQLKPLLPAVGRAAALDGADLELRLGEAKPFGSWEVKLYADGEAIADRLRTRLSALGFRDDGTSVEDVSENVLRYGGASAFARQAIRWLLAREGIKVAESKMWGDDDDDVWLYVRDPSFEGRSAKQRYPVEIHGDDYERMDGLKAALGAAGFEQVSVRSLDVERRPSFRLTPGPMTKDPMAALELREVVEGWLAGQEVDPARFPLRVEEEGGGGHARIELPIGAWAGERLRPWAGAWPDRWEVVIRTDDPAGTADLRAALAERGYTDVRVEALPPSTLGFALRWGAAKGEPEVADWMRGLGEGLVDEAARARGYGLSVADTLDDDDPRVIFELPLAAARRMPMADRVREAARGFDFSLKTPSPDDVRTLTDQLRAMPWKEFEVETEGEVDPEIQYGGAPVQLVEHVQRLVERATGIRLPLSKDWGDGDDDIWVHLPRPNQRATADDEGALDLAEWLAFGVEPGQARPLLDVGADRVRIGDLSLPRRQGGDRRLVPTPELFAHYCLDQRTAETLLHVAESVILREPCLLEGETSVSKTSIVLYLAMLADQPVVRLNLNGQTDTGELIGRYVPQDVASALPVDPAELFAAQELLESESRMILQRAAQEGRTLSRVEIQQIMANERMVSHPWRWQDGLVVTAMKKGWWLVLDELNLAEPQILERLNPVLEPWPTLVLTEHDNSLIGPGGHPVHPDFRVFATMNPAEYAGRSPLSPAWRDRWRGYRFVQPPGEAEYHAMLRYLVHGEQPEVVLDGQRWLGEAGAPPMAALAEVPGIDDFLRALARFHAALEEAVGRRGGARAGQLGARRRDRYVFSRRGLLSVMEYLASTLATDGGSVRSMRRALARYYLGRVQPGADQRVVARLLDAAGIGPSTWAPERLDALPPIDEAPAAADDDGGWDDDDDSWEE